MDKTRLSLMISALLCSTAAVAQTDYDEDDAIDAEINSGAGIAVEDPKTLFEELDQDDNGNLSWEEFVIWTERSGGAAARAGEDDLSEQAEGFEDEDVTDEEEARQEEDDWFDDEESEEDVELEEEAGVETAGALSLGDLRTGDPEALFAELDVNGDGEISVSEAQAMNGLPQQIDKADMNADQALSMEEFVMLAEESSGLRGRGNNDFLRS